MQTIKLKEIKNLKYTHKPVHIDENQILYVRGKLDDIGFNTIYKDGNKYYIEEDFNLYERLCKRLKLDTKDLQIDWFVERLEYVLYCGEYDMKQAKIFFNEYYG